MKDENIETAVFAGGCFWCMTKPFDELPGIISVRSGYTGGTVADPTYEQVKSGATGHTEAVRIVFDRSIITYDELLDIYWRQTDPTDASGQFQDRGSNYRPVIFVRDEMQRRAAEESMRRLIASERFDRPVVTKIEPVCPFYEAEEEHQQFYRKHPERMEYEEEQGRRRFIEENWTD